MNIRCSHLIATSQMNAQSPALVQLPQLHELFGHGVEPAVGLHVVVVVVADGSLGKVRGEGPETVDVHLVAQAERQADYEQARGEAPGVDAARFPELAHAAQEGGVGEEHGEVGRGVGQRVGGAQRQVGAGAHGERRHVNEAGPVRFHAVHEVLAGPQQLLESEGGQFIRYPGAPYRG